MTENSRSTVIEVIRRVGGLEVVLVSSLCPDGVIRRVGGLEDKFRCIRVRARVIRRVGGLEVLQDIFQT